MHRLSKASRFRRQIALKVKNSSLHGLPQIFHARKCVSKVVWGLCWIFGAALTTVLIINSIKEYFKYSITTKSRIYDTQKLIFPKVTVCNLDPFTSNASVEFLAQMARNYSLLPLSNMSHFSNNLDMVNYLIAHQKLFDFRVKALFIANSSEPLLKKSLGYELKKFVQTCRIGVWQCHWDYDFDWFYHYQFGNCIVFNPGTLTDVFYAYQAGKENGLQLELLVGKPVYYSSFSHSIGAKIFIGNHSTLLSDLDAVDVSAGTDTNIVLSKKFIEKLSFPYKSCEMGPIDKDKSESFYHMFERFNLTYRQNDCMNLCYQSLIIEHCRCVDYDIMFVNLMGLEVRKACGSEELMCMANLYENITSGLFASCKQKCLKQCEDVKFEYQTSFVQYPSITRAKSLIAEVVRNNSEYNFINSSVKDYVLKVNVYFNSLSYQVIRESATMSATSLLANIGGTLGLFLGFSVLSIFEIIAILKSIFSYCLAVMKLKITSWRLKYKLKRQKLKHAKHNQQTSDQTKRHRTDLYKSTSVITI